MGIYLLYCYPICQAEPILWCFVETCLENELATMTFAIDVFLPFVLLFDLSSQADTSGRARSLGASVGGT